MNKTILLELTEKEAELLGYGLIKEGYYWRDADPKAISRTAKEKNVEICNIVWQKLEEAKQVKEDTLITDKDFKDLISLANGQYARLPLDLHISNIKVEDAHIRLICLANALIMWLNGKSLLKRLAKFDFTDMSCQYEETND